MKLLLDERPLAESDLSGNITNEYVFFAGRRAARRDNSGNVFYFFADHLGTTHTVTNSTGIPCYDTSFTPYGQEVLNPNVTSTCPPNYKFTGYELDSETGNHYAFARHYSQRLGRFLSPDPLGGSTDVPQSMNRYAYVLNMPVMAIDPSGMFVKSASPRPLCIPVLRNQPDDRKDWAVGDFGPYSDSEMEPDPPQNDCANALGQDANGFPSLGPSWSVDMPGLSIPSGLFGIAAAPNNNQIIGWVIDISEEINTYLDSNIEFCNLHPEICAAEIAYPELLNSRLLNAWTFPQLAPPTSSSVSIGPMKPAPKTPTTGSQFGEYAPALPLSAAANPYVMPAGAIPWAGQLGSLLPVFGQPFRPLGATASTPGMTGYTGDSTWGPAANGFHGWPWP